MDNTTRQALLKATRSLIDTRGVGAVSMREVGRSVGLSRSASYRHFKNKESLLAEIVLEDFNILLAQMLELESKTNHPRQILVELLKAYHKFAMENPEHYQLMFNTNWNIDAFPEIQTIALQIFQKTAEFVDKVIKSNDSHLHSAKEATAILFAFIHGLVELNLVGHHEEEKALDKPTLLIDKVIDSIFQ